VCVRRHQAFALAPVRHIHGFGWVMWPKTQLKLS